MKLKKYDHKKIEKKWQREWERKRLYRTRNSFRKKKFYILDMFPYPSGEGLHVGHPKGYIATDIISRLKRMQGFNVLHPMGFDAFGLPAENYAIKNKINPNISVKKNIARYKRQLGIIGLDYDWEREINTTDPKYYKWTQWIFLKLLEKGLAYESYEPINWCPSCKTGLANEDVENGKCERCGAIVEKKTMRQWMLRITDYADRLLEDLNSLDWPESIKESQRNWIGRSEGAEIEFKIKNPTPTLPQREGAKGEGKFGYHTTDPKTWKVLQDRVLDMRKNETEAEKILWQALRKNLTGYHFRRQHIIGNFIVDFVCLGKSLVIEVDGDIHDYQKKEDEERTEFLEERGFRVLRFRNEKVLENLDEIVKTIADVLKALPLGEGLGGVKVFSTRADTLFGATYLVLAPEHSFVQEQIRNPKSQITNKSEIEKYQKEAKSKTEIERTDVKKEKTGVELKGIKAVNPATKEEIPIWIADYVLPDYGTGAIMAVPAHDERDFEFAKKYNLSVKEIDWQDKEEIIQKYGKKVVKYKLRNWVFSRQRYWGEPIPVLHDGEKIIPVPEKNLPVRLPMVKKYEPTGTGESPLSNIKEWVNFKWKDASGKIRVLKRETNTMPQWAGSSWYYLRYMDPKNNKELVGPKNEKYWNQVDLYVGGAEHATRHLIYARFWHKFLYDIGVISTEEPFKRLQYVGLIMGVDGRKMSKRLGNVINPDEIVQTWGADCLRLYEMFMGSFTDPIAWNTDNIMGVRRFLEKVWRLSQKLEIRNSKFDLSTEASAKEETNPKIENLLNKTIKKVTEDIESMAFNTAISSMMILVNELEHTSEVSMGTFDILLKLLAPFAPHITEEIWHNLGHSKSVHLEKWPTYDARMIVDTEMNIAIQINGKVRTVIKANAGAKESEIKDKALLMPEVKKWLEGKEIKRIIFVPDKVLNLVLD